MLTPAAGVDGADEVDHYSVTMQDPEGNEFCLN